MEIKRYTPTQVENYTPKEQGTTHIPHELLESPDMLNNFLDNAQKKKTAWKRR